MDRAARTAELTRPVLPVLRLLEQGHHRVEIPAGIAGLCPAVVVAPVAAGPDHGVDAARPAEYLAQRQGDGAAGDVRARLVMVGPVVSRAEVLDPLRRVRETLDIFNRPAGFEQEDGGVGPVQQTTRDHAARGACADDHVVVTSGEHLAALNLAMKLNHGQCLLNESAWDVSAADVRHSSGSSGPRRQAEEARVIPPRQLQRGGQWRARVDPAPGTTVSRQKGPSAIPVNAFARRTVR